MKQWWKCPNCNKVVDFAAQMQELFDEDDGEAIFDEEKDVRILNPEEECKELKQSIKELQTLLQKIDALSKGAKQHKYSLPFNSNLRDIYYETNKSYISAFVDIRSGLDQLVKSYYMLKDIK